MVEGKIQNGSSKSALLVMLPITFIAMYAFRLVQALLYSLADWCATQFFGAGCPSRRCGGSRCRDDARHPSRTAQYFIMQKVRLPGFTFTLSRFFTWFCGVANPEEGFKASSATAA